MPFMTDEEYGHALEALLWGAVNGMPALATLRAFRGFSQEELAKRTGMPVARIIAVEEGRLKLTDDETDAVAAALGVAVDLLLD
jgi:transcriptional regulator with XRE-family HTH domain